MKKTFKKLLIIALYIGLILVSTKASYAASIGKTINEATNIREKASTNSETVATIKENVEVEILSEENGWYKVSYKNYTGYIRKDLLEVKETGENTASENTTTTDTDTQNTNTTVENTNTTLDTANTVATSETSNEQTNTEVLQKGYQGKLTISVGTRLLPSINSGIIETLPENTSFTIKDVMNKWCYIETENTSGWILLSKLSSNAKSDVLANQESKEVSVEEKQEETNQQEEKKEETAQEEKKEEAKTEEKKEVTKYVSTETLNVREKPDNDAKIINQVTLNTQITVIEEVDSTWSKIKLKSTTGYVASKYLSDKKTENSSRSENVERTNAEELKTTVNADTSKDNESTTKTTESTSNQSSAKSSSSGVTGADVVQYAKQYLGYKYVSGGSSPSTGFDCSGFTSYVYKHFGYSLNRVSKDQINNGTAVEKSNLKEGDIVLFKGSSGSAIGHVGIYIGGNMFIHAANPSKGVVTTSMSDSYYMQRYIAARRIIN